jgi:predicted alpha/beta superfamily hydrolase
MGHSLAGYLVAYALLQQLAGKYRCFNNYLAASPSIHYDNYYLFRELRNLVTQKVSPKVKAYFTFGGLEDQEEEDVPGYIKVKESSAQLEKLFSEKFGSSVKFKVDHFSNLEHMETPFPSFTKGLQWVVGNEN